MATQADNALIRMVEQIQRHGVEVQSRNSLTKRCMNLMVTFDRAPLVTIRRTAWKNALREMEWTMSGSSNIKDLHEKVHSWWKPWADESGEINNNYSKQFRRQVGHDGEAYIEFDQIAHMLQLLKTDPYSRRNVMTTWNSAEMASTKTPITNCHGSLIQAFVDPDNRVHLTMHQRSCDMLLGVPHDWIEYWALLQYLAHQSGRDVGTFTWIGGDCHIYEAHFELAQEMVQEFKSLDRKLNQVELVYAPSGSEFKADDFSINGSYEPLIKTRAKMIV